MVARTQAEPQPQCLEAETWLLHATEDTRSRGARHQRRRRDRPGKDAYRSHPGTRGNGRPRPSRPHSQSKQRPEGKVPARTRTGSGEEQSLLLSRAPQSLSESDWARGMGQRIGRRQ